MKRWIPRAFSVSAVIVRNGFDACPHAPGVVGKKMTLYLFSIFSLGSFNTGSQFPSCCSKHHCIIRPEMQNPGLSREFQPQHSSKVFDSDGW